MQTFRNIYGIGEAVYDIIFKDDMPQSAVPGGSTLNSFITLGRCGLHPSLITETGDDLVAARRATFRSPSSTSRTMRNMSTTATTRTRPSRLDCP